MPPGKTSATRAKQARLSRRTTYLLPAETRKCIR
jgi:hypothetical protein